MMNEGKVKEVICRYVGRERCFLVGRGTTAIHLALKAIERLVGAGEVVLPTIACPSLAQVALSAGFKPVFADVRADNFTLDADSFREQITERTRAVLPVHIFGYAAPMSDICAVARARGVFVIEDAAQSLGGSCDGKKMGAHGDFSILSFGGGKILDASAGGAVLTNDPELAAAVEGEVKQLPPFARTLDYSLKSLSHRNLYHAMMDLLRVDGEARVDNIFLPAVRFYEDLYLQAFPEDQAVLDAIARGFENLDDDNERRLERAARYESRLEGGYLALPSSWKESGVVWRYTLLVKDAAKTKRVTAALRKNKIHASNHYWSAADLFYGEKSAPTTAYVCPRILNVWVDLAAGDYVERSCDIILRTLD